MLTLKRFVFLTFASILFLSVNDKAFAQNDKIEAKQALTAPAVGPNARPYSPVYPLDAIVAKDGSVYVVDLNGHCVWRFNSADASPTPTIVVQGSSRYREAMNTPRCLVELTSGELLIGDTATRELYRWSDGKAIQPTINKLIGIPVDLAISKTGKLFVADLERRVVWKQEAGPNGEYSAPEPFLPKANARGVFVDQQDRLWVVSQNRQQLVRYDASGAETVLVSSRIFDFPHQVVVDSNNIAWISDGYQKCLWKFVEGSPPEKSIQSPALKNPVGLFLFQDRPCVVDPHARTVFKCTEDYKLVEWVVLPEAKDTTK
jgi:ligand-binding sensor domain-containing protein